MMAPINQENALHRITPRNIAPRNFPMPPTSYVGSAYHAVPGLRHPMVYPGGIMSHQPLSSPGSVSPTVVNINPASPGTSKSPGGQVEGCYLHVYLFFQIKNKVLGGGILLVYSYLL